MADSTCLCLIYLPNGIINRVQFASFASITSIKNVLLPFTFNHLSYLIFYIPPLYSGRRRVYTLLRTYPIRLPNFVNRYLIRLVLSIVGLATSCISNVLNLIYQDTSLLCLHDLKPRSWEPYESRNPRLPKGYPRSWKINWNLVLRGDLAASLVPHWREVRRPKQSSGFIKLFPKELLMSL